MLKINFKTFFNYYKIKAGSKIAEHLVEGIVDVTLDLDKNPHAGQKEESLSNRIQEFRYLVFKNYKIVYWIDNLNNMILISNVFDSRQNPIKLHKTP